MSDEAVTSIRGMIEQAEAGRKRAREEQGIWSDKSMSIGKELQRLIDQVNEGQQKDGSSIVLVVGEQRGGLANQRSLVVIFGDAGPIASRETDSGWEALSLWPAQMTLELRSNGSIAAVYASPVQVWGSRRNVERTTEVLARGLPSEVSPAFLVSLLELFVKRALEDDWPYKRTRS